MIDHDINPRKKDKNWFVESVKSCWNDFKATNSTQFYNNKQRFEVIRQYMNGEQDISIYKKILVPDDQAEEDFSDLNVSWDIIPIIPKFTRMISQLVRNQRYRPAIHAVDNLAVEDQDKYYAEKAAEIVLRDELKKAGIDPSQVGMGDKTGAMDFDELEMEMEFSYKDNTAKSLEIILSDIMEKNRYEEDRDRLVDDLIAFGIAIEQDYVDFDGEIRTRYVDPDRAVLPASSEPDFSDAEYVGEVRQMSLTEIMNLSDESEIYSPEFEELRDRLENRRMSKRISPVINGDRVDVLEIEIKTTNEQLFESRKRQDGSYRIGKKTKGSRNKELFTGYIDVVYKGFWVVDTDYYFGFCMQTNMKRPNTDLKHVDFSYNVYAPFVRNGSTYSLGASMIPLADQIQLAWYKVQNAIVKARPKGVAINADSLQGVMLDGQEITPRENLDMFNFKGSMVVRFMTEDGDMMQAPIKELANGLGTEADEYFNVIERNINLLRQITGINEITDGSSPDPKTLKSVAQMASLSSSNSIRYIHEAEKKLTDRVGTALMNRIMDAAEDGTLEYYVKAVGSNAIRTIKLGSEVYGRQMALYFEEEPTEQEREELDQFIAAALQSTGENGIGQITIDDAVFIKNIRNNRKAWQFLSHRVKKNRERMEEQARLRIQDNAKEQQQSAIVAEQEKRKTIEFETQQKAQLIQLEKQLEFQIKQLEVSGKLSEESEKTRARISEASIRSESAEFIEGKKLAVSAQGG